MKRIQTRKMKTHQAQITCDVEHTMVKYKALSNPSNPLQILGSRAGFKNQFSSEKTYSCKLHLKRLKHAPGSSIGSSVFIYTPNSKPQAPRIKKNRYFRKKTRTGFCLERFSKIIIWNSHWRNIFSVISRFLAILEQPTRKSSANSKTMLEKKKKNFPGGGNCSFCLPSPDHYKFSGPSVVQCSISTSWFLLCYRVRIPIKMLWKIVLIIIRI